MRFIRGHNSKGMNRSKPWKPDRYVVEDRGYATPCWVWQLRVGTAGYGMLTIEGKTYSAHRWYFQQARGEIPRDLQLDHLCDQRTCVNPAHLEPVTGLTNTRRGRSAKLTDEEAEAIWRRRQNGETIDALADAFGVSRETARLIGLRGPSLPRRERIRR